MKLTEAQARALLAREKDVQKALAGACLRELYAGGYPVRLVLPAPGCG